MAIISFSDLLVGFTLIINAFAVSNFHFSASASAASAPAAPSSEFSQQELLDADKVTDLPMQADVQPTQTRSSSATLDAREGLRNLWTAIKTLRLFVGLWNLLVIVLMIIFFGA